MSSPHQAPAISLKTVVHLTSWIAAQSQPPPPKKVLLVTRNSTSPATKEFSVHYNRLIAANVYSKTASTLNRAVVRAETAKDLICRLPKMLKEQKIKDFLSQLQFLTFCAANWIRRFAEDRHNRAEWNMFVEKKEANELADRLTDQVALMFDFVTKNNGNSQTNRVAFDTFEIRWKQQDMAANKVAAQQNEKAVAALEKAWNKAVVKSINDLSKAQQNKFIDIIDQLEDTKVDLTFKQRSVVQSVKVWMSYESDAGQPWRTQGITTLGPFGIAGNIDMKMKILNLDNDSTLEYEMEGPVEHVELYSKGLGGPVRGKFSPICPVTVKKNDPVRDLIRIPPAAKFFAFAYPVITADLEVFVENKSSVDAFLLFGGFVYFDKDKQFIQANGLWVGSNLQMSAPKPLPESVADELKKAGRFHDITLPNLHDCGAKQFAWILPGEFSDRITVTHGGWCYLYDNPEVNNYFCIASADSILGKTRAVGHTTLD